MSIVFRNLLKFATNRTLPVVRTSIVRNVSDFFCGSGNEAKPVNAYYSHFNYLEWPENKVFATYVWIDGSGIIMRSKDRILNNVPKDLAELPTWNFDGSSTGFAKTDNSDTLLVPVALYRDPFRLCPHLIVLCETYFGDGTPTPTNHRAQCAKVLDKLSNQEPEFSMEQEYVMLDKNFWPYGWPTTGYPVGSRNLYSYCGVGPYVAGREIAECHARACAYAGMDFLTSHAEVMKSSWEFKVGVTRGIRAADDLWLGRYLLARVAENFGAVISYHPKPMGEDQPGIGCHHNFSVQKMRSPEGSVEIEKVCKKLCDKHKKCMENYGLGDGKENRKRLTGQFGTSSFDNCTWGVGDLSASILLPRRVMTKRGGYLEDRRPAGDCDPYRVCTLLGEACL